MIIMICNNLINKKITIEQDAVKLWASWSWKHNELIDLSWSEKNTVEYLTEDLSILWLMVR